MLRAAHDGATWFMVGLIWLVQGVHYPMFSALDRTAFRASHAFHVERITRIVLPAMVVELVLAAVMVWQRGVTDWAAVAGLGLVIGIWLITFLVMVPLHERLQADGFGASTHAALVKWNGFRTFAWSARGVLVMFFL